MERMHFFIHVLGGEWTKKHKDKEADAVGGYSRAGVKAFCDYYHLPKQMTCYFSVYGYDPSHALAKEWCARMEYYYGVYLDAEGDDFMFCQEEVDEYVPEKEWFDFMTSLDIEHPAFSKGMEIMRMKPRLGPPPPEE